MGNINDFRGKKLSTKIANTVLNFFVRILFEKNDTNSKKNIYIL